MRSALRDVVSLQTERATLSGALKPLLSDMSTHHEGMFTFLLCVKRSSTAHSKPIPRDGKVEAHPRDPFVPPYERDLHVAWGSPKTFTQSNDAVPYAPYTLVLNKFPVVKDHLLLVSTDKVDQRSPLSTSDFSAWWTVIHEGMECIGFYNGGRGAGGSQPHRHMQIIPTPIHPTLLEELPFEKCIRKCVERDVTTLHSIPELKFPHCCASLDGKVSGERLCDLYHSMLIHMGIMKDKEGVELAKEEEAEAEAEAEASRKEDLSDEDEAIYLPPYNLLLTHRWMMLVPRTKGSIRDDGEDDGGGDGRRPPEMMEKIGCNGMNFFGSFYLRSTQAKEFLIRRGAMNVLREVSSKEPLEDGQKAV